MTLLEGVTSARLLEALGWALVNFLWQGATIGIGAAIVLLALRRYSANARYLVCCAAFALMAIAPVATFFIVFSAQGAAPLEPVSALGLFAASETTWSDRVASWLPSVALGYVIAALLLQLRLGVQLGHAQRLKRRGCCAAPPAWRGIVNDLSMRLGLHRTVQVVESSVVAVPTVVGWLQPFVLVPVSAISGLSPAQLRAVLAHELAHIRRHDYLVNLIQAVIESLLFYHPAVWWLSRRIRDEREFCCDDIAVRVCGDSVCYARALSSLVSMRDEEPLPALASTGGSLMNRIGRLVGVRPVTVPRPGSATVAMLAVAAATVAISSLAFAVPAERAVPLPATAETAAALASIGAIDDRDGELAERLRAAGLDDAQIRIVLKVIESRSREASDGGRRGIVRRRVVDDERHARTEHERHGRAEREHAATDERRRAHERHGRAEREHAATDERHVRDAHERATELYRHLEERLAASDLAEEDVSRLVERAMKEAERVRGRVERQHATDRNRRHEVEQHLNQLPEWLEWNRRLHEALTQADGQANKALHESDERAHEIDEHMSKLHEHLQKQFESAGITENQLHEHLGRLHEHLQKQLESSGVPKEQIHEQLERAHEAMQHYYEQLHRHQSEAEGSSESAVRERLYRELIEHDRGARADDERHLRERRQQADDERHLRDRRQQAYDERQIRERRQSDEAEVRSRAHRSAGMSDESISQLLEHMHKLQDHLHQGLESGRISKEQAREHLLDAQRKLEAALQQLRREGGRRRPHSR